MMYRLKPTITYDDEIILPNCMYTLKNINGDPFINDRCEKVAKRAGSLDISDQVIRFLKQPLNEMTELELRQVKLLEQLEDLQKQIMNVKSQCKIANTPRTEGCPAKAKRNVDNLPNEIVINVSTKNLPYSLVLLQEMLANEFILSLNFHIHSTVPLEEVKVINNFVNEIKLKKVQKGDLNVRIIFKNVGDNTELIVNSTMGIPIIGEVNILRYLARLLPAHISYDEKAETDNILDMCHLIQRSSTPSKDKQDYLKTLLSSLQKAGKNLNILDIITYSLVRQVGKVPGSVPAHIAKWIPKK